MGAADGEHSLVAGPGRQQDAAETTRAELVRDGWESGPGAAADFTSFSKELIRACKSGNIFVLLKQNKLRFDGMIPQWYNFSKQLVSIYQNNKKIYIHLTVKDCTSVCPLIFCRNLQQEDRISARP